MVCLPAGSGKACKGTPRPGGALRCGHSSFRFPEVLEQRQMTAYPSAHNVAPSMSLHDSSGTHVFVVPLLDRMLPVVLIVVLAAYPLDPYRLLGTNVSIYRLAMVLFVLLTTARALLGGRIHNNVLVVLTVLFLGYLSFRYAPLVSHSSWGVSKFRAYLVGGVFALCISQGRGLLKPGILGLQISLWVTAPFVWHTVYEFVVRGRIVTALPSIPGFSASADGWLAEGHVVEGVVRLSAPFPTPPFLGLLGAICAVATWWQILHMRSENPRVTLWRHVTMGLAVMVILASMSRSAILPGVAWCLLLWVLYEIKSKRNRKGRLSTIAGVAAVGAVMVVALARSPTLRDLAALGVQRTISATGSFERHIETRLTAVDIWLQDTRSTLFGRGFGEYAQARAARGEPHSHSPYTTLLAETGLVGVVLLVTLLLSGMGRLFSRARLGDEDAAILLAVLSMLTAAFVLYEFLALQFVWAVIGLAACVRKGEVNGSAGITPQAASRSG